MRSSKRSFVRLAVAAAMTPCVLAPAGCGPSEPEVPVLASKGQKSSVEGSIDNPFGVPQKDVTKARRQPGRK